MDGLVAGVACGSAVILALVAAVNGQWLPVLAMTAPQMVELIKSLERDIDELQVAVKGDLGELTATSAYKKFFEAAHTANIGANVLCTDFDT